MPRSDHFDDVAGCGGHVNNIRTIDPRMAGSNTLFAARGDGDSGRAQGSGLIAHGHNLVTRASMRREPLAMSPIVQSRVMPASALSSMQRSLAETDTEIASAIKNEVRR